MESSEEVRERSDWIEVRRDASYAKTSFNLFISLRIERNILVDLLANDSLSKHFLSPYNGVFDRHRRYCNSKVSVLGSENNNFNITAQDLP